MLKDGRTISPNGKLVKEISLSSVTMTALLHSFEKNFDPPEVPDLDDAVSAMNQTMNYTAHVPVIPLSMPSTALEPSSVVIMEETLPSGEESLSNEVTLKELVDETNYFNPAVGLTSKEFVELMKEVRHVDVSDLAGVVSTMKKIKPNRKTKAPHPLPKITVTSVNGPFICNACGVRLKNKETLNKHLENEHSDSRQRIFECYQCPLSVNESLDGFVQHIKDEHVQISVEGIRGPFKCEECDHIQSPKKSKMAFGRKA